MNLSKKLLLLFFGFTLVACSNSKLEPMPDSPLEGFDESPLPFPGEEEDPSLLPDPTRPGRAPAGRLPSPLPPESPPPSPRLPIPPITDHQLPPFQGQGPQRIPVQPHCPCVQPPPCQQAETHPYTASYTKVLFIVDKSRWQNDKYDFGAEIRMNYVRQYYEERRQSGWSWGIIAFSDKYEGLYPFKGSIVWPLILSHRDKDHPAFTDDYQRIHRAINNIGLMEDVGKDVGTGYSYQEPLALAKRTIERDIEESPGAEYHIIFIASGVPKGDHHNDGVEGGLEWRIFERIDDILELSPNKVSLSTVYYGENRDPATRHTRGEDGSLNPSAYGTRTVEPYNARTVLQAMAERGHGFYDEVLTSSRPAASYTQPPCNCGPSLEPGYHPVEDFSQPDYGGLPPCMQQ